MDDDSPWEDNPRTVRDTEWNKLESDYVNAGYREGITAGKEAALQEGFDDGFAHTGAPLGRQIGLLRGFSSALLSVLTTRSSLPNMDSSQQQALVLEMRSIVSALGEIRFSDIAPPDMQAIEHAQEHLDAEDGEGDVGLNEALKEKKDMEGLEDLMKQMGAAVGDKKGRPRMEDVRTLTGRIRHVATAIGVPIPEVY